MIKLIFGNPVRLLEFITVALFLVGFISQILYPLLTNTPLFPLLSRKPRINKEIRIVNELTEEEKLEAALELRRKELEARRQARQTAACLVRVAQAVPGPSSASSARRPSQPQQNQQPFPRKPVTKTKTAV